MDFYLSAPVWTNETKLPGTTKFACPKDEKMVHNETVITIKDGMYRDSLFNGTFLLSKSVKLPLATEGKRRVEVYCRWFGHRLPSINRSPAFLVDLSKVEVTHDFTGLVFTDLKKITS